MNDLSIYFHWPYCKSKCPYCDFFSHVKKNVPQDEIIKGYLLNLEEYANILGKEKQIISIFFGGGTPSLIKPQNIELLINKIRALWTLSENAEISLEANPNTHSSTLFTDLANAGINRLSLGVQSLNDEGLKFLGRTHDSKQALSAIEDVKKNFNNHSVDLIYALPSQNINEWQKDIEEISSFDLKHISLYQLTIEENTIFHKKGIKPADEETAAQMYSLTEDILAQKAYNKYEVSNYAQKGFESVHNQVYWNGGNYIGIGETAHGRLKLNNRFYAITHPMQFEELSPHERAEELIIMGLRLTKGINKTDFKKNCGINLNDFINQNFKNIAIKEGLLQEDSTGLFATKQGFLLLDYLIRELCC